MRSPVIHRLAVATTALLALLSPTAAHAAPSETGRANAMGWYLALGDSLAAGYQPNRTPRDDPDGGYVGQVLDAVRTDTPKTKLVNLACSGATTTSMLQGDRCTYEEGTQFAQAMEFLHAHRSTTRLVTLTVGANDITPCLSTADPAACAGQTLPGYGQRLGQMVAAMHAVAPDAHIVVTNYYNPYLALWLNPATRSLSALTTQLQQALNGTIARAVGSNGDVADVATAFSSYDVTPVGGVPTNVARVCAWTWMCTSYRDIHANDAGYTVIAGAVVAKL